MSDDFFGDCHKCGEKVIGEGNGCSAMGEVYHVSCFTCVVCAQPLRGKQFYAINVSVWNRPPLLPFLLSSSR